jgi:hypothetical protein
MPNHVHLVAILTAKTQAQIGYERGPHQREARSISTFMGGMKGQLTARINTLQGSPGLPVLQRGFHDHIIRSEESLFRIWEYIDNNPRQWELDGLHPKARSGATDKLDSLIAADANVPMQ